MESHPFALVALMRNGQITTAGMLTSAQQQRHLLRATCWEFFRRF